MTTCDHPRKFRLLAILIVLVPFLAPAADRPDIVVFLSDDHTLRDSSVYNPDTEFRTPNMSRIAAEGMTFENAYVVSPSCAPSRATMLTGLLPQHNGAKANLSRPRADIRKLPAYLHELGYWTSWVEKAAKDADAMRKVRRCQFHPAEELYRTGDDRFEERNLADDPDHAETLLRLRGMLDDWLVRTGDKQTVFGKPESVAKNIPPRLLDIPIDGKPELVPQQGNGR